jgi:hypothetical protein
MYRHLWKDAGKHVFFPVLENSQNFDAVAAPGKLCMCIVQFPLWLWPFSYGLCGAKFKNVYILMLLRGSSLENDAAPWNCVSATFFNFYNAQGCE